MKNRILFLVFIILLNTVLAFGEVNNISDVTQNKNNQIESSDNTLAEGFTILEKTNIGKSTKKLSIEQTDAIIKKIYPEILEYITIEDLYIWIENRDITDQLTALGDAIHEENHMYSYKTENQKLLTVERKIDDLMIWVTYKDKDKISTIYNINGVNYIIKPSKTFNSNNINNLIPSNARGIFHKDYIDNPNSLSNKTGIFGMINEYNSYSKELEFYKRYSNSIGNFKYSKRINNLVEILVEIENYILAYLIYAQDTQLEYYEQYMSNLELKQAYSRIKDKIEYNIKGFHVIKDSPIYEIINKEEFREMQERFYIEKKSENLEEIENKETNNKDIIILNKLQH